MDLDELREEIARTDSEIIELVSKRIGIAQEIGDYKVANGLPIRNVEVEKKVISRYRDAAEDHGIDPDTLETVARALIREAVDREARITLPGPVRREISVIGGGGRMGAWLSELFERDGHRVKRIDTSSNNGLTLADAASSDIVIVSVPMDAADGILNELDAICRDDALIFDIASLKTPIHDTLLRMAQHRKVCSVHPMFGPSVTSMYGRNLLVCDCGNSEAVAEARALFDNKGADLKTLELARHDEYMAYVLGLSHAVNIAFFTVLERSGIGYGEMCTVASTTFRKNMETNESVALEDPLLYYEIQNYNAFRDVMWERFSGAVDEIKRASIDDDPSDFVRIMDAGRKYFSERSGSE